MLECSIPTPCSLQSLIHARLTIMTTAAAFWKSGSFPERLLQEISGAYVHTKPRSIEATCIVSGERGRPHISLNPQCKQQNLGSVQQTRL